MEPNRLFARLYLDEDVHVRVASIVRGHGYEVDTARGEGMLGAGDEDQLAFAADNGRVLVTHNRVDFEILARRYFDEGRSHSGIVCAVRRPPTSTSSLTPGAPTSRRRRHSSTGRRRRRPTRGRRRLPTE
jgi:hypothetical protein